jgi:hypothetical protein
MYLILLHFLIDSNHQGAPCARYLTPWRDVFFRLFDASVHTERIRLAPITRLG